MNMLLQLIPGALDKKSKIKDQKSNIHIKKKGTKQNKRKNGKKIWITGKAVIRAGSSPE